VQPSLSTTAVVTIAGPALELRRTDGSRVVVTIAWPADVLLAIDQSDDRPLYRQLARSVRRAVVSGEFVPGANLPAIREAAAALGVNPETVQRAYRLLVDEGIVVSRVGRGTRACATTSRSPSSHWTTPSPTSSAGRTPWAGPVDAWPSASWTADPSPRNRHR